MQVSFHEHKLLAEPFLLVGLLSAIRRVLLLTAVVGEFREHTETTFWHFVIALPVITVLVVALSASLLLLRKASEPLAAERSRIFGDQSPGKTFVTRRPASC